MRDTITKKSSRRTRIEQRTYTSRVEVTTRKITISVHWRFYSRCFWNQSMCPRCVWIEHRSRRGAAVCTLPFPTRRQNPCSDHHGHRVTETFPVVRNHNCWYREPRREEEGHVPFHHRLKAAKWSPYLSNFFHHVSWIHRTGRLHWPGETQRAWFDVTDAISTRYGGIIIGRRPSCASGHTGVIQLCWTTVRSWGAGSTAGHRVSEWASRGCRRGGRFSNRFSKVRAT